MVFTLDLPTIGSFLTKPVSLNFLRIRDTFLASTNPNSKLSLTIAFFTEYNHFAPLFKAEPWHSAVLPSSYLNDQSTTFFYVDLQLNYYSTRNTLNRAHLINLRMSNSLYTQVRMKCILPMQRVHCSLAIN